MILYSQRDPRWSSHALGWGPKLGTIGEYGCLDTVDAMIATDSGHPLNPAQMDDAFTAAHIFVKDPTGTYDLLPDNALALAFPGRYTVQSFAGFRGDLIKTAVPSAHTYAVLWISTAAVPTHFVIAWTADASAIADPWTGTAHALADYGGPAAVHKTVLVTASAPAPPVPPAPVPVPTPPPAPAPPPQPQAFYSFHVSPSSDLHPPDGVMTLATAQALAEAYVEANPGSSCAVWAGTGVTVYEAPAS